MPETPPPDSMTPTQFGDHVGSLYRGLLDGDDPNRVAGQVERSLYRLDPLQTALPQGVRATHVLLAALRRGVEIVDTAASEASREGRRHLGGLSLNMELDVIQTELVLPEPNIARVSDESEGLINRLLQREQRQGTKKRLSYEDRFMMMNARALDIQVMAEGARSMPGSRGRATRAAAQATLGGLIIDCTRDLPKIAADYNAAKSKSKPAPNAKGAFTEEALFLYKLLDWYETGVTKGKMVRFAMRRENRPYVRLPEQRQNMPRRGFDLVTRQPGVHDPVTLTPSVELFQSKTARASAGDYEQPIQMWYPKTPDIIEHEPEISGAFRAIINNEGEQTVAQARVVLASYLG